MGQIISNLFGRLFRKEETKILMLGLENAGKTTILYKLNFGEVVYSIPTIGFSLETVEYKSTLIISRPVGGSTRPRPLLKYYYAHTQGLIFVVDSSDRDRIIQAQEELQKTLSFEELKDVPLLVLTNKQDLAGAMSASEVAEKLDIITLKDQAWHIQGTCAVRGDGLYDGFQWLTQTISKKEKK